MFNAGTTTSGSVSCPAPAVPATGVQSLTGFWDESRLRADDAKATSIRPAAALVPWRIALEEVLKVGYGLQTQGRFVDGAWEQVRWRTTPSAGALYPFEVIACVIDEASYLWDVETHRLLPCNVAALTTDVLRRAGVSTNNDCQVDALLVVVARPWLSMRKYQRRGYLYCHLDVGHVTTNLALYSAAVGYTPTVHLRFSRTRLASALGLGGLCREPLAVLAFGGAASAAARERRDAIEHGAASLSASLELPGASEIENWESLMGIHALRAAIEVPCAPASRPLLREPASGRDDLLIPLAHGGGPPSTAAEWRSAILTRRSAKGFQPRPLAVQHIGELLAALRAEGLPADCASRDEPALGVRLVASNLDGFIGVFAYSAKHHAVVALDTRVDDLRPACMKQRIAEGGAALLVFHAPRSRLLEGYSPFVEAHFNAAQLGQRLHLAAARLDGVGMTCLGGFDGGRCAALARLDAADEPVYAIMLGTPDEFAVKDDRLRVAFSHGFATTEG